MNEEKLICPVCKENVDYAKGRTNVTCISCGSQFEVSIEGDRYSYKVTMNARKIVWAPPLAWPKLKQEIYFSRCQLKILEDDKKEKIEEINGKIALREANSPTNSSERPEEIAALNEELRVYIEGKDKEITELSKKLDQQLQEAKETGHPEYC